MHSIDPTESKSNFDIAGGWAPYGRNCGQIFFKELVYLISHFKPFQGIFSLDKFSFLPKLLKNLPVQDLVVVSLVNVCVALSVSLGYQGVCKEQKGVSPMFKPPSRWEIEG